MTGRHTRAHVLRAIYEGVVFSHKYHLERLLKLRDAPRAIRMSGGVTRSQAWVQLFADVLQLPVELTEAEELGTLGAAMCAMVAVG
jgi:L-xylulokinase